MLKAFVTDLTGIPEESQGLYKKHEGGYIVDIEAVDGYALENLAPLKNALTRQKEKVTELTVKIDGVPDGFDFAKYEKDKEKFETANSFNREQELKDLTIAAQKSVDDEFKKLIGDKDTRIDTLETGLKSGARETLYGKLQSKGWDKLIVQGVVESMTKVEIGENGASVTYVNPDGTNRRQAETNGDQRAYNDDDLVNYLTEHETFGKLVETKANNGNGGQQQYANNNQKSVITVPKSDAGKYMEGIDAGTHVVAE